MVWPSARRGGCRPAAKPESDQTDSNHVVVYHGAVWGLLWGTYTLACCKKVLMLMMLVATNTNQKPTHLDDNRRRGSGRRRILQQHHCC